jgi:hypothetical protein
MRKRHLRIIILLWVIGILFPMAFLGKLWPAFGIFFNSIFASNWMHILMHGLLYAMLGFLLTTLVGPSTPKAIPLLLGSCLLVGVLHEGMQLWAAQMWPGLGPELFDLGVDLIGSAAGIGLARSIQRRTASKAAEQEQGRTPP